MLENIGLDLPLEEVSFSSQDLGIAQGHRQGLKGAVPPPRPFPLSRPIINWRRLSGCSHECPPAPCQLMARLPSGAQATVCL